MRLSLCIATIHSRKEKFDALRYEFLRQANELELKAAEAKEGAWVIGTTDGSSVIPVFEILWERDHGHVNGGRSIGAKRQAMLERAEGDFHASFDDDDFPAPDYLKEILNGCKDGIDCIGFDFDCFGYDRSGKVEKARVSNRYKDWLKDVDGFRYVRCPHHKMPIRREHALKVGFPDLNYAEDAAYSFGLRDQGLLKNEHFIDKVLYIMRHDPNKKPGE